MKAKEFYEKGVWIKGGYAGRMPLRTNERGWPNIYDVCDFAEAYAAEENKELREANDIMQDKCIRIELYDNLKQENKELRYLVLENDNQLDFHGVAKTTVLRSKNKQALKE